MRRIRSEENVADLGTEAAQQSGNCKALSHIGYMNINDEVGRMNDK